MLRERFSKKSAQKGDAVVEALVIVSILIPLVVAVPFFLMRTKIDFNKAPFSQYSLTCFAGDKTEPQSSETTAP